MLINLSLCTIIVMQLDLCNFTPKLVSSCIFKNSVHVVWLSLHKDNNICNNVTAFSRVSLATGKRVYSNELIIKTAKWICVTILFGQQCTPKAYTRNRKTSPISKFNAVLQRYGPLNRSSHTVKVLEISSITTSS